MILSRFFLNALSRDVQRAAGDAQELHARVLSMFPDAEGAPARATFGVLHRLEVSEREGTITLLVQSKAKPDWARLPETFLDPRAGEDAASSASLEPLFAKLSQGAMLRFRLRANPTRKIATKTGPDGKKNNGRRVPVRARPIKEGEAAESHDDARLTWLQNKLEHAGVRIARDEDGLLVRQRPDGIERARKHDKAAYEAHVFEGVIEVIDPTKAREAIINGVGPAKAYGFGLLSLAPI